MPFPSPAGAAASVSSRIGPCRKNSGPNEREPRRIVRRAEDRPARAVATVAYRMPPQKTAHTPSVWSRRKTLLKIPPDKVYKAKSRITDNRASRRVVHATAAIHGRYARRADRSERLTDDRRFSRDGTASVARVNSGVPRITDTAEKRCPEPADRRAARKIPPDKKRRSIFAGNGAELPDSPCPKILPARQATADYRTESSSRQKSEPGKNIKHACGKNRTRHAKRPAAERRCSHRAPATREADFCVSGYRFPSGNGSIRSTCRAIRSKIESGSSIEPSGAEQSITRNRSSSASCSR